jgi:hypothetical protein
MNVENILRLADAIEKRSIAGLGFNMMNWIDTTLPDVAGHPCGTAACIAGWAYILNTGRMQEHSDEPLWVTAQKLLGLDVEDADNLFEPGNPDTWADITDQQAVRTLRHLAATGEVNWNLPETTP